jgi:hypothetical protein
MYCAGKSARDAPGSEPRARASWPRGGGVLAPSHPQALEDPAARKQGGVPAGRNGTPLAPESRDAAVRCRGGPTFQDGQEAADVLARLVVLLSEGDGGVDAEVLHAGTRHGLSTHTRARLSRADSAPWPGAYSRERGRLALLFKRSARQQDLTT